MLKIGLTGGIGSGKSTVAALLAEAGLEIVDADRIAREVVEPGRPALAELAEAFGADILSTDGTLNRGELARRAFVDPEHTELLNSITHPRISAETARRYAGAEAAGTPAVGYDMPLLIEQGLGARLAPPVVVDVPAETRVQRLVAQRGMDESDARARIAAQISDERRRAAADVVLDNSGPREALDAQVAELVERVDRMAAAEPAE